LPSNVTRSEKYDSVHDEMTWCSVEGPGARRGPVGPDPIRSGR
jgi:hypothetical protein